MRVTISLARWCLVALAAGACTLQAQESAFGAGLKLRGLISSPTSQGMKNDAFSNGMTFGGGFGLEGTYAVGSGKLAAELGYMFQSGNEFLSTGSVTAASGATIDATSIESRKNKLEGVYLRLGYQGPISSGLSWYAGLQFGGQTFKQQVLGTVTGTNGGGAYTDSYVYVSQKTSFTPSPYGGVSIDFDESGSLQVGVMLLQFTSLNYQHVAGASTNMDTVPTTNRIQPTLEVAYAFHF